uniref:Uncharacterized protein n=1 Tax=Amphimedon queenslandica TaxID=400682 RepID=A0A1X7VWZ4_AMPQE
VSIEKLPQYAIPATKALKCELKGSIDIDIGKAMSSNSKVCLKRISLSVCPVVAKKFATAQSVSCNKGSVDLSAQKAVFKVTVKRSSSSVTPAVAKRPCPGSNDDCLVYEAKSAPRPSSTIRYDPTKSWSNWVYNPVGIDRQK